MSSSDGARLNQVYLIVSILSGLAVVAGFLMDRTGMFAGRSAIGGDGGRIAAALTTVPDGPGLVSSATSSAPSATATPIIPPTNTRVPSPTNTSMPPTATATSTPAPKPGDVLYQADWSSGTNGWAGDVTWKTVHGMLVNDGRGIIKAPYKPGEHGINDYAVEAEIQFIDGTTGSGGIIVRSGYQAGYQYSGWGSNEMGIGIPPDFVTIHGATRIGVDNKWHVYRANVDGNEIRLSLDGADTVNIVDNKFLEGGEVGLWGGSYSQLNVRSFRVIAR